MENYQEKLDDLARKAENLRKSRDYFKAERNSQKMTYDKIINDLREQVKTHREFAFNMEKLRDRHETRIEELYDELYEEQAKVKHWKTLSGFFIFFGIVCFFLLLIK